MKLIEYFLTFQSLFIEFQTSLLVFENKVCEIKTLRFETLKFNDSSLMFKD